MRWLRDVTGNRKGSHLILCRDFRGHLLHLRHCARSQDDACAFPRKRQSNGPADAATATRDKGNSILKFH
jgi:hypothetical protein